MHIPTAGLKLQTSSLIDHNSAKRNAEVTAPNLAAQLAPVPCSVAGGECKWCRNLEHLIEKLDA